MPERFQDVQVKWNFVQKAGFGNNISSEIQGNNWDPLQTKKSHVLQCRTPRVSCLHRTCGWQKMDQIHSASVKGDHYRTSFPSQSRYEAVEHKNIQMFIANWLVYYRKFHSPNGDFHFSSQLGRRFDHPKNEKDIFLLPPRQFLLFSKIKLKDSIP